MNKKDKATVIFYIIIAVSYPSVIIYMDQSFSDLRMMGEVKTPVNGFNLVTAHNVTKTKLFDTIADVRTYPIISPDHFISVKVVNQSGNIIYAEEQVREKLVTTTLLVKHTIIPYSSQTMEVMNGDAQGTKVTASFTGTDNTTIATDVQLHLKGKLAIFVFIPKQVLELEFTSVLGDFAKYSKGFDNKYEKIVDDLYREILHRPADDIGLKYWGSKLEQGHTVDDIRKSITESPEAKSLKNIGPT